MVDPTHSNSEIQAAGVALSLASKGDKLYVEGSYQEAFNCFHECVRLRPAQPAYHHRLASAAWKLGRSDDVDRHYLEAIRLNPWHSEPHKALAQWLLTQGKIDRALYHSQAAHDLAPEDLDVAVTHSAVLDAYGHATQAWKLLAPAIDSGSTVWHVLAAYSRLAPKIGHEAQAAAVITKALAGERYSRDEAVGLRFSAAALLDLIGNYDAAFIQARLGNELGHREFDPIGNSKWIDDIIRYFTPQRLASLPRATHKNARPIFIVGVPRSGTSLVEQILASHPAIFGAGELSALNDVAASLPGADWTGGAPYPDCLDSLSIAAANRHAADYLRVVDALDTSARYVTDKMPHNYNHLWLAEVLFPDCHVIHCVRDPRDTCLSCYLTDFNIGNAFKFDLAHLASFYRDYRRLMDHWKQAAKLPILEVRYEDMVGDIKGQTERMLGFLNLGWDDACLNFHKSKRAVLTASREQVRKPLYSTSVGRWRNYEKHIPELLAANAFTY